MGYLAAIFCGLIAWMAIDYGSFTGLLFSLGAGALVLPPIWKWLEDRGKKFYWGYRWGMALVLLVMSVFFNGSTPAGVRAAEEQVSKKAAVKKKKIEELANESAKSALVADIRKRSGEHCLSGWDGSFPALKNAVKMSLRNPRSFEHVGTNRSAVDSKGKFGLVMVYRAENGFGGMNVEKINVEVTAQNCAFKKIPG